MNQKWRQESKNSVEKDFYKLMSNSNFGYDSRNNIGDCKFVPIFDEYMKLLLLIVTTIFLIKGFLNLLLLIYINNKLKKNLMIN